MNWYPKDPELRSSGWSRAPRAFDARTKEKAYDLIVEFGLEPMRVSQDNFTEDGYDELLFTESGFIGGTVRREWTPEQRAKVEELFR